MTYLDAPKASLGIAIRLRQLVHTALDRDDMPEVRRLNRLADAAYAELFPWESRLYREWAMQFLPTDMSIGRRHDD